MFYVHNFINNKGNSFINSLSEETKILGMTATPFQGIVGNVKYVEEISHDMKEIFHKTISACILNDQLSPICYSIIRNEIDIDN